MKASTSIPRPHSADFLEFEARMNCVPPSVVESHINRPRPKSSLDINSAFDHLYYSEENYAEQMRTESANYLPKQKYGGKPCSAQYLFS